MQSSRLFRLLSNKISKDCIRFFSNRRYTKTHEWIAVKGNKGVIGITEYAQKHIGDIVYCEVTSLGKHVVKDETVCGIESVKAAGKYFSKDVSTNSPVDGKIVAANQAVIQKPALINKDPYEAGWVCEIEIEDKQQLDSLLDDAAYEKYLIEVE